MSGSDQDIVWKALSDPVRRRIVDGLKQGPLTTGDVVALCPKTCRTNVMKHLEMLVKADLVRVRREGRVRWNHLNPEPLDAVCGRWIDSHRVRLRSALQRLKQIVEEPVESADSVSRQNEEASRT